jgi:hypothetical protein
MADVIRATLDDREMASRAAELGALVRASDAVGAIVRDAQARLADRRR